MTLHEKTFGNLNYRKRITIEDAPGEKIKISATEQGYDCQRSVVILLTHLELLELAEKMNIAVERMSKNQTIE